MPQGASSFMGAGRQGKASGLRLKQWPCRMACHKAAQSLTQSGETCSVCNKMSQGHCQMRRSTAAAIMSPHSSCKLWTSLLYARLQARSIAHPIWLPFCKNWTGLLP